MRVTPATLCAVMHLKDLRRMSNLREDTLGQVLSNAIVSAGRRVLVADGEVMGVVTAECVRRMGGYGSVISLFDGAAGLTHLGYCEGVVNRMNLTVSERQSLRWVNTVEVFCNRRAKARQMESLRDAATGEVADVEQRDRERIAWPAPLQPHTRDYNNGPRCRNGEGNGERNASSSPRQCDSLIITTKYDPTATLFCLLPYLAPSCPFVVYHELLHTFHALQNYYVPEKNKGGGDNDVDDGEEDSAVGDDDNGNHENPVRSPSTLRRPTTQPDDKRRRRQR